MTKETFKKFVRLCFDLSPENINMDGEASANDVKRECERIDKEWKRLEQEVGRRVSEYEIWDEYFSSGKEQNRQSFSQFSHHSFSFPK